MPTGRKNKTTKGDANMSGSEGLVCYVRDGAFYCRRSFSEDEALLCCPVEKMRYVFPDTPENRAALGMPPKEKSLEDHVEDHRKGCPICHTDSPPPAREVVELEGYKHPIRRYIDTIDEAMALGGRLTIIHKKSGPLPRTHFPDTPRNRWLLRQAGIEVKE